MLNVNALRDISACSRVFKPAICDDAAGRNRGQTLSANTLHTISPNLAGVYGSADGWPVSSPLSQRSPRAYNSSTSEPVSCGMSSLTS